jgi:hypothetical protein
VSQANGLETALDETRAAIKKHIYAKVSWAPSQSWVIQLHNGQRLSPPNERILELTERDLRAALREEVGGDFPSGKIKGAHNMSYGKIFLVRDVEWCRTTLIHETLHSASISSRMPHHMRLDELIEGLTEFFTGLLMFKEYPNCYAAWTDDQRAPCVKGWAKQALKVWWAISTLISVRHIIDLYFWNNQPSWEQAFQDFFSAVKFRNILEFKKKIALRVYLERECAVNFGMKFDELHFRRQPLDFSLVEP